jgi:hypothetical protein
VHRARSDCYCYCYWNDLLDLIPLWPQFDIDISNIK